MSYIFYLLGLTPFQHVPEHIDRQGAEIIIDYF